MLLVDHFDHKEFGGGLNGIPMSNPTSILNLSLPSIMLAVAPTGQCYAVQ